MRTKHLLLLISALVIGGYAGMKSFKTGELQKYQPTKEKSVSANATGYAQWFNHVRVNPKTNSIDASLIKNARQQVKNAISEKSDGLLSWNELGPNNIGGRTRALLVDKDDNSIVYAASVTGGLFKSNSGGQAWSHVETSYTGGPVTATSISQASNGNVYVGTGEIYTDFCANTKSLPLFEGSGVFVLESGNNVLTQLASTDPSNDEAFRGITKIAVDPTNAQSIYISTWKGVYKSTDAGATWAKESSLPSEFASDVKINSNGVIVTNAGGKTFVNSGSGFVNVSGTASDEILDNGYIYEYTFAPTDPNYVYSIASDSLGVLLGVFRSTDAGSTWELIGVGGSDEFKVFGDNKTGLFSMMIYVDKDNKDVVYIGGENLWRGYKINTSQAYFDWTKKSTEEGSTHASNYLHENLHYMVSTNGYYLIATDGGISKYDPSTGFRFMNNNYNCVQLYNVGYSPKGEILGASQSTGLLHMDFSGTGFQKNSATVLSSGSFTNAEYSQIGHDLMLFEGDSAELRRNNGGEISNFWNKWMQDEFNYSVTSSTLTDKNIIYNTPFDYWERNYNVYDLDTNKLVVRVEKIDSGTNLVLSSVNVDGAPVYYTTQKKYLKGDTIKFPDKYNSFFAIGIQGQLWFTRKAANFRGFVGDKYSWIDIFNLKKMDVQNQPENVRNGHILATKFSPEGKSVYFAIEVYKDNTFDGNYCLIYRIDSLHEVLKGKSYAWHQYDHVDIMPYIHVIGRIDNQVVTNLAIDPKNENALIVTLGNYVDVDHIYYAANAETTTSEDFSTNFTSIQGDLPKMPIFTALVNTRASSHQLLIGTEYGVWATTDYTQASPSWTFESNGFGAVPVMGLKQQIKDYHYPQVKNYGNIYVATFGRGVFVDSSYYTGIDDNIPNSGGNVMNKSGINVNLFPNPIQNTANFTINVKSKTKVVLQIIDVTGKVYKVNELGTYAPGQYDSHVDMSGYQAGIYYVIFKTNSGTEIIKAVKN